MTPASHRSTPAADPERDTTDVEYTTTVKLFVDGTAGEWLACAIVYLYDRDIVSRDDFLGMGITNEYGEASFTFHRDGFADIDDRIGGPLGEPMPELYIKVFGRDDRLMLSTRALAQRNQIPRLIRVGVPRDLAREHGLL